MQMHLVLCDHGKGMYPLFKGMNARMVLIDQCMLDDIPFMFGDNKKQPIVLVVPESNPTLATQAIIQYMDSGWEADLVLLSYAEPDWLDHAFQYRMLRVDLRKE